MEEVAEIAQESNDQLDTLMQGKYQSLFQSSPYERRNIAQDLLSAILIDARVVDIFRLN